MHISEATLNVLASRGWTVDGMTAQKLAKGIAPRGRLSNGDRVLHVRFDETGRWLEDMGNGFIPAFEFDSRNYVGEPEKFADHIEFHALKHAQG